jgi:uncharacterized membrane protein
LTQVKHDAAGRGSIGARRGGAAMVWETAAVVVALALALALRPWQMLRHAPLRHPWLAALVLLPWLWSTDARLPGGLPLQLSLAALMVLMFGWPLAVVTAVAVAAIAAWLVDPALAGGVDAWWRLTAHVAVWSGVLPASFGLAFGLATRRWLPRHLMVYILARGFLATLLAMTATGALWVATQPAPPGSDPQLLLVGRWLIAWGDAVTTGMLTAVFVAFRPEWLVTYSDRRYLPGR